MNSISIQALRKGLTMLCLCLLSGIGYAQTTVTMTVSNMVQTGPNTMQYDVYLTNTGSTSLALRGYSWGLNPTPGLSNGGTLTHSFVSRDASLALIPVQTPSTLLGQLRFTTTNVVNASAVAIPAGVPIRLATMIVATSTSWPFPNFNPFLPTTGTAMQVVTQSQRTACVVTCVVTPPGTSFVINGTGNNPAGGQIQGLTGSMIPSPTGTTPFLLNPCTAVVNHVSQTACDSYTWPNTGLTYTASGTYFKTTSQGGSQTCFDSLYLHLTLNSTSNTTTVSTCDSYTWSVNGQTYSTSGTYTQTSLNGAGCTHTEKLVLTIQNTANTSSATACDSYLWAFNGQTYTASGVYTATSINGFGCTNVETLVLTINNSTSNTTTLTACDSYTWAFNNQTYTTSGTYVATSVNAAGCTNTETLNLTVNSSTTSASSLTVCDAYVWNGSTYTNTGVYTQTSLNAAGCINTDTLNLTVNYSTSNTISATACDSYTWTLNNQSYSVSGVYTVTSMNAAGCTNTEILNLTINNSTSASTAITACDSYTWTVNNQTYTASGTYTVTSLNAAGCTHTQTLNLTINSSTSSSSSAVACDSYVFNGSTYTNSGVYTQTSLNAAGCINTHTLNLTVNYSTSNTLSATACDSYAWSMNNQTYTVSGTYTSTSMNSAGCTQNNTLNLTINNSTSAATSMTACNSYTWASSGVTYSASGVYTYTSLNAVGCTHTEILTLTVNQSTSNSSSMTACNSFVWTSNGQTYTTTGVYTHTSINAAGCTHTETLNLTINYSNTGSSTVAACNSYVWNGTTYTTSGNPTHVYTNMAGCDSVHTLNLTIRYATSSSATVTAYACYTWNANNQSYSTSGTYITTLINAAGCDSVVTLNVTIIPGLTLACKAILAGPYDASTGLMTDSLRTLGLLPLNEPYSGAPYFVAGGGQTISPALLSVSGPNAIVDWVYLELRNAATPAIIVATQRALIQRDGDVVSHMDGVSPVYFGGVAAGNYYVSIKQRNHLGVMTVSAVSINSCAATVNFTTGTVWVKNDPLAMQNAPRQLIGSVFALWAGDAYVDKRVRGNGLTNDRTFLLTALGNNTNNVLYPVYRSEDMNMDGTIRFNGFNNDKNVIVNTIGLYTPNNTVYQHTPN